MMNPKLLTGTTILIVIAAGTWGIYTLLNKEQEYQIEKRVPGMSGPETSRGVSSEKVANPEGTFVTFDGTPSNLEGTWPRFRGPTFDNINHENIPLADTWDANGPPVLWSLDLGEGHSGPTVLNGKVYILDYDEKQQGNSLRCFSFATGQEIWRRWYKIPIKRNHGISRSVPAVTDKFVVSIGPKGHVMCVDANSGDYLWSVDMANDYHATIPNWYTAQCPLIDNGLAILAPAGDALMIAVECATGQVIWQTPNPDDWTMSHSSVFPITLYGKKMYVYCALGGMAAVSAEPDDRGRMLWETEEWKPTMVAPVPIVLEGNRLLVTAGYGAGSMLFQVEYQNDTFSIRSLATIDKSVFASEQQTPLYYEGHLFTILPADAGTFKQQFVCYDPDQGQVWASGSDNRFGLGPYLIADGKIFILNDDGLLTLIEANIRQYVRLAQAQVLDGQDAWAPMALTNGRLLLRDSKRLLCLDVRAH